jgi:hypothetical protein
MSAREGTATRPETSTPSTRPGVEDWLEAEDEAVSRTLGLRPIAYRKDEMKHSHPDQRPCPSWCWVGQDDEAGHEVDSHDPMTAVHTMPASPHIVASLYEGEVSRRSDGGGSVVVTATIEVHLEQVGQGDPTVTVYLRHYVEQKHRFDELLRLTLTDTEELSTSLAHIVRVAES